MITFFQENRKWILFYISINSWYKKENIILDDAIKQRIKKIEPKSKISNLSYHQKF